MPGLKTNERPGTRAVLRHHHMSATKARQVLDLIRGRDVDRAQEVLVGCERGAAEVVSKVLASAVANAMHNDGQDSEDLYVSACFADEGVTLKRWRPRARGRATRIRKRTCHITIELAQGAATSAAPSVPAMAAPEPEPIEEPEAVEEETTEEPEAVEPEAAEEPEELEESEVDEAEASTTEETED